MFVTIDVAAILAQPLESLELSVRMMHTYKERGIFTVGDLIKLSQEEISAIKIGKSLPATCVAEVESALNNFFGGILRQKIFENQWEEE